MKMSSIGYLGRTLSRRFSTSLIRRSEFQQHGIPGSTSPFNIYGRFANYKVTFLVTLYFSSGLTLPFAMGFYQMRKNAKN